MANSRITAPIRAALTQSRPVIPKTSPAVPSLNVAAARKSAPLAVASAPPKAKVNYAESKEAKREADELERQLRLQRAGLGSDASFDPSPADSERARESSGRFDESIDAIPAVPATCRRRPAGKGVARPLVRA